MTQQANLQAIIWSRSWLVAWAALLLGWSSAMGQGRPDELPLPPGYEYPRLPSVTTPDPLLDSQRECASCTGEGDLRLYYRDYAGFRRNLDRYAGSRVSWELLTFEHGFKTPWRGPQDAIRLYQHNPTTVRLVTRDELVVFVTETAADGTIALRCESSDAWSIRRDGNRVVVRHQERSFAFETPDAGATWRLVETAPLGVPLAVKLHYAGGGALPSALEYPDGTRAILTPTAANPDVLGTLALPNGIVYKLEYDPAGFPRLLEEHVPGGAPPKPTLAGFTIVRQDGELHQTVRHDAAAAAPHLARRWAWENDPLGRIRHYLAPCDRELTLAFTEHTSPAGTETLALVTDTASGSYRFLRHLELGDSWTIDRGRGESGLPVERAPYSSRTVQQNRQHHMRVVARQAGPDAPITRYSYDPEGQLVARTRHAPDGAQLGPPEPVTRVCDANLPRFQRDPGTDRASAYQRGPQTIAYTCDERGFLATATTASGQRHEFQCDDLGRLLRHDRAERREGWTYTPRDLCRTYQSTAPAGGSFQMTYTCDELGRLVRTEPAEHPPVTYTHTCQGVASVTYGGGQSHAYRYDNRGRLREHTVHAGEKTLVLRHRYQYRPDDGRLATLVVLEPPAAPIQITYAYDGAGRRTIASHAGLTDLAQLAQPTTTRYVPGLADAFVAQHYNRFGGLIVAPQP